MSEVTLICSGCGCTWTGERLAAEQARDPRILSCCPEREMVPVGRIVCWEEDIPLSPTKRETE